MQIYELTYRSKIIESVDELTTDQIKKVLSDVEKTAGDMSRQPRPKQDLRSIDMTPGALLGKGLTALRNITKPKTTADSLYQTWIRNNKSPTASNLATMLSGAGIDANVIKNVFYRQKLDYGKAPEAATSQPTSPVVQPVAPAPTPTPAAAPAAPAARYSTPTEAVDALIKSVPKDWLPQITTELLKRQSVSATGSTAKKRR
jgi:hypothetical protein